jgi:hypothetical protein
MEMEQTMKTAFRIFVGLALLLPASQVFAISVLFSDPAGGWTYAYEGEGVAPGTTAGNDFTALDGTWDRQNGSDEWDGSGLGGTLGDSNRPGGISALTEGTTRFIRMQDTGDPRSHSFADPSSNRKMYPGHNIANDAGVMNPSTIGEAVTMSFRSRIATPATGILDAQFPNGENGNVGGTPWQAGGNGYLGHDGGKGTFNIRQTGAGPGNGVISFSLSLASDLRSDNATPFGMTGLTMNSLNGTAPSATVDPFQNEGTINILPVADLTQWHEFWITIEADQTGGGTHKIEVYLDGSSVPTTFNVTAGTGDDYGGLNYLAMGLGSTGQQGAVDVDFFAYKEGIHLPGGPLTAGDVDGDGVGGEYPDDFAPIQTNFRKTGNRPLGDLSGNGTIDFPDFREWKDAHLGMGGSLAGLDLGFLGGNIPEPSTIVILLVSLGALAPYRCRSYSG